MSDAIREVVIRYKMELDQASVAATTQAVTQAAKNAQAAASSRNGNGGFGGAGSPNGGGGGAANVRNSLEAERREYRRHFEQSLAERKKAIQQHQREQERAAKASAAATAREEREEQRRADGVLRVRQRVQRQRMREEEQALRSREVALNRAARVEEMAANKAIASNARVLNGLKGMGSATLSAVRAVGLLAAAHSETASKALEIVLVFEGTAQAVGMVSRAVTGATRIWQGYNAAMKNVAATEAASAVLAGIGGVAGAAKSGAVGAAGAGTRGGGLLAGAAGGAAAGGAARLAPAARMFGWGMSAAPYVAATAGTAFGGWSLAELATGRMGRPGSLTGLVGGLEFSAANWAGKKFGYDLGGEKAASKASAAGNAYNQSRSAAEIRAQMLGSEEFRRQQVQREREDALRQMRPNFSQTAQESYGRSEGLAGRGRAAALAEARGAFLGRSTASASNQWFREAADERFRGNIDAHGARWTARGDLNAATRNEARARAELARLNASRRPGGNVDAVATESAIVNQEEKVKAAIEQTIEARKRSAEVDRATAAAKMESQRGVIEGLRNERDMYRELAQQMREGGRSALQRFGSMSAEDQQKILSAKRKMDAGGNLNPEEMAALEGVAVQGTKTERALRTQQEARARAGGGAFLFDEANAKAGEADARARTITAKIERENKIAVQLQMDEAALMTKVAEEVGKSFKEYDKIVNERMAKVVRDTIQKAIEDMRKTDANKQASRAALWAGRIG